MYLYKTFLYTDTSDVLGAPASNTDDLADFNNNHKASAVEVNEVLLAGDTFVTEDSYTDFKARVTSWADVKYVCDANSHTLYLLSETEL